MLNFRVKASRWLTHEEYEGLKKMLEQAVKNFEK